MIRTHTCSLGTRLGGPRIAALLCTVLLAACSAPEAPPPEPTKVSTQPFSEVEDAITWAEGQGVGNNWDADCGHVWAWWCQHFVGHAYLEVPSGDASAYIAWTRDYDDKYGDQMVNENPPRGALAFFDATPANSYYGHVGLAVGDGTMWHAWTSGVRHDDIHDYSDYLGWRWPNGWTDDQTAAGCDTDVAGGTTTIDDTSTCFARSGSWWSSGVAGAYGSEYWYTYTTDDPDVDCYGKWFLDVTVAGDYEVEVYIPGNHTTSTQAEYLVWHDETASYVTVDQTAVSGWVTLGTFHFDVGADQAVRLDDNTGELYTGPGSTTLGLDALRMTEGGGNCHPGAPGGRNYCTAGCTCATGEGDCDVDRHCDAGLYCVYDNGSLYGFDTRTDTCGANCHADVPGGSDYCDGSCLCGRNQGDCDTDADCEAGLSCIDNVGWFYGWLSGVDVCQRDCHLGRPGGRHFCTEACPCSAGIGDCDRDSHCNAGLNCIDDVGANYGYGANVDVCE